MHILTGILSILFFIFQLIVVAPAYADDHGFWAKDNWQLRMRAVAVVPDDDSTVNIGDSIIPELDITYFVTGKIALQAIIGTSRHQGYYNGSTMLGRVWGLPPTVTLQHPPLHGSSDFSPYIGAGISYRF